MFAVEPLPSLLQAVVDLNVQSVQALLPTAKRRYEIGPNRPSFVSALGMSLVALCLTQFAKKEAFVVFELVVNASDPNVKFVFTVGFLNRVQHYFRFVSGTPLMFCVLERVPVECCLLLLERGGDPNVLENVEQGCIVSSGVSVYISPSGSLCRDITKLSVRGSQWDSGVEEENQKQSTQSIATPLQKVTPLFEVIRRCRHDVLQMLQDHDVCNFVVMGSSASGVAVGILAVVQFYDRFEMLADILMHSKGPKLLLNDSDRERVFCFMNWSNPATKRYMPVWFKETVKCVSLCMNRVCTENAISPSWFKDVKRDILFRMLHEAVVCPRPEFDDDELNIAIEEDIEEDSSGIEEDSSGFSV